MPWRWKRSSYRSSMIIWWTVLLISYLVQKSCGEDPIASKQQSKESEKLRRRCPYSLRKLWQTDISSFPFAAAPIIADVNGDGKLDIVSAPFGETIAVLEGDTGRHLHGSGWPQHNLDKSIHSSPIQFDIDGDGILDLLFVTSKGEGLFYNKDGSLLHVYTFQLEPAHVKSRWFDSANEIDYRNVHSNVFENSMQGTLPVDPHVFDTPVLHEQRYLVVPLSFFFSDDDYSEDQAGPWGNNAEEKDKYYVTAVAVLDLKEMQTGLHDRKSKAEPLAPAVTAAYSRVFFLELHQTPVVTLFSPTVMDLDADFSSAEIVLGSSSGNLYVLSLAGQHRQGFPQAFQSLSGRITAANLDKSPSLELVVTEKSGNVTCLDTVSAKRLWSAKVGGTSFAGSRVVDVNLDGQPEVVLATSEGNVFALNGVTGEVIPNYPYKASKGISGNILVTKFNKIRGPYDLVFLSDDGVLHILASDHSCESQVALAETSLVDLLLHDLSPELSRGGEVLVSTADGSLVCLGSGQPTPPEEMVEDEARLHVQRLAVPGGASNIPLSLDKGTILIEGWMRHIKEVTGSSVDIYFTIHSRVRGEKFNLRVYMGSELVLQKNGIESSPAVQSVTVQTPEQPGQAQVTLVASDRSGYTSQDSLHLKFNQLILLDLQWLVLSPFIAMIIILLVNHGFPAKDLLPVTFPFKSK